MGILPTLALAVGLGMDAMSVSAAIGVKWHGPRQRFRLAWHMGLFQFGMPLAGWALGSSLAGRIQTYGSFVAAALVIAVGVKMLYEALRSGPETVAENTEHAAEAILHVHPKDPTRGWSLLVLSVATSLDALVAGVSLGIGGHQNIAFSSLIIGLVAGAMSLTGVLIGRRVGRSFGRRAELVGAIVLIAMGVGLAVM